MNKVLLKGKLVTEPRQKSEKAPCEIRILAFGEWKGSQVKGKNNNEFLQLVIWGKQAQHVMDNFKKGDVVFVEGILTSSKIQIPVKDNEGNVLRYKNKDFMVTIDKVEIKVVTIDKLVV